MPEKLFIPGFGSPPPQLPPFAAPGRDLRPSFGPGNGTGRGRGRGRGAPFRPRGDGGFEMQNRPENPGKEMNINIWSWLHERWLALSNEYNLLDNCIILSIG